MWDSKGIKLFMCMIWWQKLNPNLHRYNDIPVLPATDFSCCFARELVLTLYIAWDTTKGKWTALLLSFKGFRLKRLFRASLVLTEQVYIHALQTKLPFVFRFVPRSQSSLGDLFTCMWGNGSENADHFQNACFEFQCLLLVLANSELLLVHTKSLTLHVK